MNTATASSNSAPTITLNEHGDELRSEFDYDCNGSVDESFSSYQYTYDQDGEVIERVDPDDEDFPPICHRYDYYPNGNVRTEREDWGCDGEAENCTSYTYDPHGGRLTAQYDSDCSCRFVNTTCRRSTYDTSGNEVSRNGDDDCDGVADYCVSLFY